jgi:septal ring-binding cell division protein DamX
MWLHNAGADAGWGAAAPGARPAAAVRAAVPRGPGPSVGARGVGAPRNPVGSGAWGSPTSTHAHAHMHLHTHTKHALKHTHTHTHTHARTHARSPPTLPRPAPPRAPDPAGRRRRADGERAGPTQPADAPAADAPAAPAPASPWGRRGVRRPRTALGERRPRAGLWAGRWVCGGVVRGGGGRGARGLAAAAAPRRLAHAVARRRGPRLASAETAAARPAAGAPR